MRHCLFTALPFCIAALPLAAETTVTNTDSYIMGAGRWTCAEALAVAAARDPSETGQLAGWILGVWSRATTEREKAFTEIVERVGGQGIYEASLAECSKAPGSTRLYQVVYSMIDNTNPQN